MNDTPLDGDRGVPPVATAKSTLGRLAKIVFGLLVTTGVATAAVLNFTHERQAPEPEKTVIASNVPQYEPAPVNPVEVPRIAAPAPTPIVEVAQPVPVPLLQAAAIPQVPSQEELERIARRRAPGVVFSNAEPVAANAVGRQGIDELPPDELTGKLTSTPLKGVAANRLADNNLMIPRGDHLDCTLETAIDTTQPGLTSCILARDIYGFNGKVLLLEKGSKITGQYQGGIRQGQSRIFVLWSRIATPGGILVNLDSPGTDALGRSGHEGYIDTHFWERFGATLLLSVIDDALKIGGDRIPGGPDGDNNVDVSNTSAAGKDAAGIALENSINIQPTLYKNQGETISIFVARDLDFRSVYELRRNMAMQ